MRGAFCYLPILPARFGAFRAVGALSPIARSRLTPIFDVRAVVLRPNQTLDTYLGDRARGMHECWEQERPMYVDVHDLPLDLRTLSGAQPIAYLVDALRKRGSRAIPVTGTKADRGRDYLNTVRALMIRGDGVCLRLGRDEFEEPKLLNSSIPGIMEILKIDAGDMDIVLDLRYVGRETIESLRATLLEVLQAIYRIAVFRNVVVTGSSVPELLTKKDQSKVRREPRRELELWVDLLRTIVGSVPIPFSDYAIVGAHYAPPAKVVRSPARIRYTTPRDFVFRRANRNQYREICRQLIDSEDYSGTTFSVGDQRLHFSANEHTGPGNPALWVAYDTNHHLELVSEQAWNIVRLRGLENLFMLPAPSPRPWLQPELIDS